MTLPCSLIKQNSKHEVSFEALVYKCATEFQSSISWAEMGLYDNASEYQQKAEIILEILEVIICGSVGGFDNGQSSNEFGRKDENKYRCGFDRLVWIWNKYTYFNEKKEYLDFMKNLEEKFRR